MIALMLIIPLGDGTVRIERDTFGSSYKTKDAWELLDTRSITKGFDPHYFKGVQRVVVKIPNSVSAKTGNPVVASRPKLFANAAPICKAK